MPRKTSARKTTDKQQLAYSGGELKKARLKAGMSAQALADRANCSAKQVYHCEKGENWFYWPLYVRICGILGLEAPPLS